MSVDERLAQAVITQALQDTFHKKPSVHIPARKFFWSEDYEWWCSMAGLRSEKGREYVYLEHGRP